MFTNQINISHLEPEVETQHTHYACLMTHLSSEGDFTTSELRAINRCRMSKGILFISDISNHQGTHLQQSETDKSTNFNLIHNFNSPRKIHTTPAEWRTRKKAMNTLCVERKDNNKYITYWKWFLSSYLNKLYYREHET